MKCPLFAVAAVAALLLLPSCQSGGNRRADTNGLMSDGFPAPSKELVVMAAENAVKKRGYAIDRDGCSVEKGVLTTRWRTQMAPFSGQGYRERVTVQVSDVEGRANYFNVETNVIRESNMNLVEPSNPVMAEWKNPTRQVDMEALITRSIEMHFLTGEVSDEFRARYGVGGNRARIDAAPQAAPAEEAPNPMGILPFGDIGN